MTAIAATFDCTVVIPVFNRGEALAVGAVSLRAQTLGAQRIEVIYVDDGSNDGRTPALIDAAAAAMPNARVFHEPASGSPGRPRNVGLQHARGEYVFFADHDDWFDPEALERLVGWARQCESDVVIGKVVAHGSRIVVPRLFRASRARLSPVEAMISLTPHKLFRRDFLVEHGLRYPEGKRRLEDHFFVTHAYLHARTISVYADRICYHHNHPGDDANFSQTVSDPQLYIDANLEVVELIRRHTEVDPELCEALLERPLRHELLKKASPRLMRQADTAGEARKQQVLRAALLSAAPQTVVDRLGAFARATAKALRDDDAAALRRIDDHAAAMSLRAQVLRARATPTTWALDFEVTVVHDKQPVLFHRLARSDDWSLDTTVLATQDADRPEHGTRLRDLDLEVLLASRRTSEQWHLPTRYETALVPVSSGPLGIPRRSPAVLQIRGRTTIDFTDIGGAQIGAGVWDIVLRADTLGVELGNRFTLRDAGLLADLPEVRLAAPSAVAQGFVTERRGTLAVRVTSGGDREA